MENKTSFKIKIASFWNEIPEKQRQSGLLILAILTFVFASELLDMNNGPLADYNRGFNSGLNYSCEACPNKIIHYHSLTTTIVTSIIGLAILVFPITGAFWAFGQLFYGFLFRLVLSKITTRSIITFIFFVLTQYNLLYIGIKLIFLKNEAFVEDTDLIESIREYAAMAISFMLLSFIIAYGFIKNSFKNKEEQAKLLQQKSQAEIRALKAQINPHFLFNTLNNLYGTALVEDSPKTAGRIEQLAGIMRHAVESSKNDSIGIEKEIKFIHDYIEIQQIRLPDVPTISVIHDINWNEQPAEIAPLILMTFIENAFKYGISTNQESFVNISLIIDNKQLVFVCKNSIVQRMQVEAGTGTGIDNTKKRLELLYPQNHTLQILEEENEFNIRLTINLT